MVVLGKPFIVGGRFFLFLPAFLSLPAKVHIKPLFDCFSILILMFSIAYFNT
jgi:hypothetical protein